MSPHNTLQSPSKQRLRRLALLLIENLYTHLQVPAHTCTITHADSGVNYQPLLTPGLLLTESPVVVLEGFLQNKENQVKLVLVKWQTNKLKVE